jgi:3-deoxy-D-manno-octulosonic acid (KDO) 8-phosphate synthase
VFLEVHPDPDHALSDRAVQLSPERAETLLASLVAVRAAVAAAAEPAPAPAGEGPPASRSLNPT